MISFTVLPEQQSERRVPGYHPTMGRSLELGGEGTESTGEGVHCEVGGPVYRRSQILEGVSCVIGNGC